MISQKTIDDINNHDLVDVISKYVQLKKSGSGFSAKSPFTDEKSASFFVNPKKGIWKCFSTGKGGNTAFKFVADHLGIDHFPDQVKELCNVLNIIPEYDNSEESKKYQEKRQKQIEISEINHAAMEFFQAHRPQTLENEKRLNETQIDEFLVGYANGQFKSLLSHLKSKGISENQIIEAGLAKRGEKGVFDLFNNRIMFPIQNKSGVITGFGGRIIGDSKPKYLNTPETSLFDKSSSLYGLHKAIQQIRLNKYCNLVEGYHDVIQMQSNQHLNTVATCGTSLTPGHLKLLKPICDTIRLFFDGDKAGIKAAERSVEIALPLGFNVEACFLPDGEDPDSIFRNPDFKEDLKDPVNYFNSLTKDAVEWLADKIFDGAKTTIQKSKAQQDVEKLISLIPDSRLRNNYIAIISKKHQVNKSMIESGVRGEIKSRFAVEDESGPKLKLPNGADRDDYENFGFAEIKKDNSAKTGYWFPNVSSNAITFEQRSNFVIKPLFHIYSKTNNRRLVEIQNKTGKRIIDVPSKGFVGMTQFQEAVIDEGNFIFWGSKNNFMKVVMKIMEKFPTCEEITTLGWQDAGFFAYADGIAETSFQPIDLNGIVKFGKKSYFLPAFSAVYSNTGGEDDMFEEDRFLKFRKSPVSFKDWGKQFVKVHRENGKIAIAFIIATLFRDFIHRIHTVFPLLFGFGDIGTGKSYMAQSVSALFFGKMAPFNLNSGTNVGFSRKLETVKNSVVWFDEYDNNIDLARFQRLKAAYDGAGHQKGTMTNNKTKSTKVNAAAMITGQYLPTRDGNALFSRCLILPFTKKSKELSKEEIEAGSTLKKWEGEGLSSLLVEIIKFRGLIEDEFQNNYFEIMDEFKSSLKGEYYDGRVLLNFVLVLVPIKILEEKLDLPFSFQEIKELAMDMVKTQSDQINDSDALRTYWKMVEYMFSTYKIEDEIDFKIERLNSLTIRNGRSQTETISFPHPTNVFFLRFTKIHPIYMKEHRQQHGENGIAETSIKTYMQNHKSFIGNVPATSFQGIKTSAYAFYYDKLKIQMERTAKSQTPDPFNPPIETTVEKADQQIPF